MAVLSCGVPVASHGAIGSGFGSIICARVGCVGGAAAEGQGDFVHELLEHADGAALKGGGDDAIVDGGLELQEELIAA